MFTVVMQQLVCTSSSREHKPFDRYKRELRCIHINHTYFIQYYLYYCVHTNHTGISILFILFYSNYSYYFIQHYLKHTILSY